LKTLLLSRGSPGGVTARPVYIPRSRFHQRWQRGTDGARIAPKKFRGQFSMENPKPASAPQRHLRRSQKKAPRTLSVDIGGTGIKAELLDVHGHPLTDRARIPTPKGATPRQVIAIIRKLAAGEGDFDRVSVGFPGVTKNGVIYTAPNLGKGWNNFALEQKLRRALKRPVRVANDADVQGLGSITGHGIELVITLGTGVGSVVFVNGNRIHLELGHHPFHKGKTYEDELGHRMLLKKGKKWWNKRLREAIEDLKTTFNFDWLYIGGGDNKFIRFEPPGNVKIVSNVEGLLGGIKLWQDVDARTASRASVEKPRRVVRRRKQSDSDSGA
jgi:polyphosphate glucokinase